MTVSTSNHAPQPKFCCYQAQRNAYEGTRFEGYMACSNTYKDSQIWQIKQRFGEEIGTKVIALFEKISTEFAPAVYSPEHNTFFCHPTDRQFGITFVAEGTGLQITLRVDKENRCPAMQGAICFDITTK